MGHEESLDGSAELIKSTEGLISSDGHLGYEDAWWVMILSTERLPSSRRGKKANQRGAECSVSLPGFQQPCPTLRIATVDTATTVQSRRSSCLVPIYLSFSFRIRFISKWRIATWRHRCSNLVETFPIEIDLTLFGPCLSSQLYLQIMR